MIHIKFSYMVIEIDILSSMQATLKQPAVRNMHKALYFQFSIGLSIYYTVTIIGYWAYGSSVSEYLLSDLSGSKWAKVLANAAMFLQSIISQHVSSTLVYLLSTLLSLFIIYKPPGLYADVLCCYT